MLHFLHNGKILALIALIVMGTIMGVLHNHALDTGKSTFPEDAIRVVIKPFQFTINTAGGLFEGAARSLRSRSAIRKENERLRKEVKKLNMEVLLLREDSIEIKRLRTALGFKKQSPLKLLAVRIISRNPSEWFDIATIDRGRTNGITAGNVVITNRGLLGQVLVASPTSAQVRALTDINSGVGAMVQRSRAVGVCQGQDSELLSLTYLSKDADIKPGDIIVTSGQGGIVPKGIPIGRVIRVQMESGGSMKTATVRPSVDFDQVEEAFIVMGKVK